MVGPRARQSPFVAVSLAWAGVERKFTQFIGERGRARLGVLTNGCTHITLPDC